MNDEPLVSICIPAYKHADLVARCLDSIQLQNFKNFEVIITDDSVDNSIEKIIPLYSTSLNIFYYKNQAALGSPKNWNYAITKAKGKYIKIMHQDDWFATDQALQKFVESLEKNPDAVFAFSSCQNIIGTTKQPVRKNLEKYVEKIKLNPYYLILDNVIRTPSTGIFRNNIGLLYDEKMKWCVDYDFYIRLLSVYKNFVWIEDVLINIGLHENQITNTVIADASVVVFENIRLLNKIDLSKINVIIYYDFFWRMMRNFKIRSLNQLNDLTTDEKIPLFMLQIVYAQKKIPSAVLKNGFCSKIIMFICYCTNKLKELFR
ncbi:MAG: glycosyltransferase family 2 protein [Chitinophagaceae bacterium]